VVLSVSARPALALTATTQYMATALRVLADSTTLSPTTDLKHAFQPCAPMILQLRAAPTDIAKREKTSHPFVYARQEHSVSRFFLRRAAPLLGRGTHTYAPAASAIKKKHA
jgi:hypothetical protein